MVVAPVGMPSRCVTEPKFGGLPCVLSSALCANQPITPR